MITAEQNRFVPSELDQDIMESGDWFLCRLGTSPIGESQWSMGVNGPHAYLTCDEETAVDILSQMAQASARARQLKKESK